MNYKQLELFDMQAYTTKKPVYNGRVLADGISKQHIEDAIIPIKYEQLELELFPQESNLLEIDFVELAA